MSNSNSSLNSNPDSQKTLRQKVFQVLMLTGIIYVFLVSLELMGASFKLFGSDFAEGMVASTSNPFVGLFIGMLATAIIQSSSTTTSIVVAMVASGAFGSAADVSSISLAVFIIMGANIGTSVTSTIVSLGHIGKRSEFRKAIAAATVHDFFNIMTVCVLFPLEAFFGILSKPAVVLADWMFVGGGDGGILGAMKFVKHSVKPASEAIISGVGSMVGLETIALPLVSLLIALIILFFALRGLTSILKALLIGPIKDKVDQVVFGNPIKAIIWGAGITTLVQSSSVTSSLTVPLVATGRVSLQKVFPFLMGANIGTTTTALIAALVSTTSANPVAGLAIAICHLFFNMVGVFIIFPIPIVRKIPIKLARKLGNLTMKNRLYGIGYVGVTFFVMPFILIMATQGFGRDDDANTKANPDDSETEKIENVQPFSDISGALDGREIVKLP